MRRKFRQIEENGHHWRQLNFLTVQWQTADEFQILLMIAYNVWLYSMYKYNVLYKSICTFYVQLNMELYLYGEQKNEGLPYIVQENISLIICFLHNMYSIKNNV